MGDEKKFVVVHTRPDLDAVACVAASGATQDEIHFWSGALTARPEFCPCCGVRVPKDARILDHELGDKGPRMPNGIVLSAFGVMPEARDWDSMIRAAVESADQAEQPTVRYSLVEILSALRLQAGEDGLYDVRQDAAVTKVMSLLLRALNRQSQKREGTRHRAMALPLVTVGDYVVAVLPPNTSSEFCRVLYEERAVDVVLYEERRPGAVSIGINRSPHSRADLSPLRPFLKGWFFHSAGFLACWGSRKAPQTSAPPHGTPQNKQQLFALLQQVLAV